MCPAFLDLPDAVSVIPRGRVSLARRLSISLATLPPLAARAVLLVLALVIALGLIPASRFGRAATPPTAQAAATAQARPRGSDADFYRAVIRRMKKGEPYEVAAVSEQRAEGYAVRPFLTVRPPLLATLLSWEPSETFGAVVQGLLALAVIVAWSLRLRKPDSKRTVWKAFLIFTGVAAALTGGSSSLFHELWAGLLIALSLALRTEKRFVAAVVLGLLAALIRELALPYLIVMAGSALMERRRIEAVSFAAAFVIAIGALALHAQAAIALENSHDSASPTWLALGGWPFLLATAKWNVMTVVVGGWLTAALVPLAVIGAASRTEDPRLLVLVAGYSAGFLIVGRPENYYWGLVIAPLMGVGLALAPAALIELGRAARRAA
ncbi:MAG: hypothetical protein ACREEB_09235 [Caulobacteraceae bacterium]